MRSEASPRLSVARLLASWLSFTRWTFTSCVGQLQDLAEGGADRVKDTVMDLGCEAPRECPQPGPLPPLDPGLFAAALRDEIDHTVLHAVDLINAEEGGCSSPVTQEQVLALFAELARTVLTRALDQQVSAAEALLPKEQTPSRWLHKYRLMMAEEGRWPPASQEEPAPGQPAS